MIPSWRITWPRRRQINYVPLILHYCRETSLAAAIELCSRSSPSCHLSPIEIYSIPPRPPGHNWEITRKWNKPSISIFARAGQKKRRHRGAESTCLGLPDHLPPLLFNPSDTRPSGALVDESSSSPRQPPGAACITGPGGAARAPAPALSKRFQLLPRAHVLHLICSREGALCLPALARCTLGCFGVIRII